LESAKNPNLKPIIKILKKYEQKFKKCDKRFSGSKQYEKYTAINKALAVEIKSAVSPSKIDLKEIETEAALATPKRACEWLEKAIQLHEKISNILRKRTSFLPYSHLHTQEMVPPTANIRFKESVEIDGKLIEALELIREKNLEKAVAAIKETKGKIDAEIKFSDNKVLQRSIDYNVYHALAILQICLRRAGNTKLSSMMVRPTHNQL